MAEEWLGLGYQSSVKADVSEMVTFINRMADKIPVEESYHAASESLRSHLNIVWLLHACLGVSITELVELHEEVFGVAISQPDAKKKLYCLKIARWAEVFEYSNKSYWYAVRDFDPYVKYRYLPGVADTNTFMRRSAAAKEVAAELKHPKQVLKHLRGLRGAA